MDPITGPSLARGANCGREIMACERCCSPVAGSGSMVTRTNGRSSSVLVSGSTTTVEDRRNGRPGSRGRVAAYRRRRRATVIRSPRCMVTLARRPTPRQRAHPKRPSPRDRWDFFPLRQQPRLPGSFDRKFRVLWYPVSRFAPAGVQRRAACHGPHGPAQLHSWAFANVAIRLPSVRTEPSALFIKAAPDGRIPSARCAAKSASA